MFYRNFKFYRKCQNWKKVQIQSILNINVLILWITLSTFNYPSYSQPNSQDANRSLFKHRKIASSFRDKNLFEFFQLAQELLTRALESLKNTKFLDDDHQTLISNLLKLTINCLSFDFIGAASDDYSDDLTCNVLILYIMWRELYLIEIFILLCS